MDLMSALVDGRAYGLGKAAVDHAEVADIEPRIFPRTHPDISRLAPAALAEVGGANRRVCPICGRPIESFTQNEAFPIAIADVWNHEPGIAPAFCWKSGVGQIDHRNRVDSEVAILEVDGLAQVDRRHRRIKLPRRPVRIANR